jgi:hypothetical protein
MDRPCQAFEFGQGATADWGNLMIFLVPYSHRFPNKTERAILQLNAAERQIEGLHATVVLLLYSTSFVHGSIWLKE